jgi:hypothetical protein
MEARILSVKSVLCKRDCDHKRTTFASGSFCIYN